MSTSSPPRVLLIGGTSEIGLAIVARLAAQRSARPYLLGRDRRGLETALAELRRHGCEDGAVAEFDADDLDNHPRVIEEAFARWGGFDTVVLAVGRLGGQGGLDTPAAEALEILRVNFLGCGSLAMEALRAMRTRGAGTLVVLSSVAGERVRASNAIYGAAKAGLDALVQGLSDSVAGTGVRVLVVRPGFVTTRMTAGLDPAPMSATADEVAAATVAALHGRAHTVWVPGKLRYVFAVLRHLPRWLFRRLPM
ncbi:MAG: decaprenylphospho-beta-D-erythro-pentofuranosid-2-ulose 2-reductase [Solirubrobacteraceae bacterium]|nr:decaprenylphospho-beta-D-erythro-pentofuranosid-2-ulose 2-reductase [Solirubrobacteraceae bacterium]